MPQAVAAGRVTVYPEAERLETGVVHFRDGRSAPLDAVILATGYRPALDPVAHLIDCDASGRPLLDRRWRSRTNPRLICIGYAYPTTEGWLQALGRVVRAAADGLRTAILNVASDRLKVAGENVERGMYENGS